MTINSSNNMDNSETSTAEVDSLDDEQRHVRVFALQMLKGRIFLGQFVERRRVDLLQTYRDVIVVHESENDLKKDVDVVRRRLRTVYDSNYWIGLTTPEMYGAPNGFCFWIESADKNPFGNYWYKIRGIRFHHKEIIVRLKIIRSVSEDVDERNISASDNISEFYNNFSRELALEQTKKLFLDYTIWLFTNILTIDNIKQSFTFISLFCAAMLTASFKGLGYCMEYSLLFMREFSFFIQSSTPFMLGVVNLIGKIVGGFYLLIAMIWRDSRSPKVYTKQPPSYRAIMPQGPARTRLTITEVE